MFEMVVDVFMSIDIVICCVTAFYREQKPVLNIYAILINYATGSMVFDVAATGSGYFVLSNPQYYWLKCLRLVHLRSVFDSLASAVRSLLDKCGLENKNVQSFGHMIDMMIMMVTCFHFLTCAWIYLGMVIVCSWLNQADKNPDGTNTCDDGGIPINKADSFKVFIAAVYWVVTTLTTVGYGDFKGYQPKEYIF